MGQAPERKNTQAVRESLKKLQSNLNAYQERNATPSHDQASNDARLSEIIEDCHRLLKIPRWEAVLRDSLKQVKSRMDPSTITAIITLVERLAEYKSIGLRLTNMARGNSIVRRCSVRLVRLTEEAYSKECIGPEAKKQGPQSPRELLVQLAAKFGEDVNFALIMERTRNTEEAMTAHYRDKLQEHIKGSRIHAEVQLMAYLDSTPSLKPPRFLASHKDACYLCNAFIISHGMYTIPRTHGRVYPGWRLPATGLRRAQEKFKEELELMIVTRARQIMGGAKNLPLPPESQANSSMGSLMTALTIQVGGPSESLPEEEQKRASGSDSDVTVKADCHDVSEGTASRSKIVLDTESLSYDSVPQVGVSVTSELKAGDDGVSVAAIPNNISGKVEAADSTASLHPQHGHEHGLRTSRDQSWPNKRRVEFKNVKGIDSESHSESSSANHGPWQMTRVEPGMATILRLSDQFHLHIEYGRDHGCTLGATDIESSRGLQVRYRRLSATGMKAMKASSVGIYDIRQDLLPLREVSCGPKARFVHLQAADDAVFQIDLGCPS